MDYNLILNSIFKEANVGIIVVNKAGIIVQNNPYLEFLFGYNKGELVNMALEVLLPRNYKKTHISHRDNYLKNPRPRAMGTHHELYGLKKDGSKFPVEISLSYSTINDELYAIGYVTDDTAQKSMLHELIESKQRLDEAQKMAHLGNFEIDWATKKALWSTEMYKIFDLDSTNKTEIYWEDIIQYIHIEDKESMLNDTLQIVQSKTGSEIDFRIITPLNKLKYLHGKREVRLDTQGNVISLIGVIQDVTKLKSVEVDLNEKVSKIQQVEVKLLQLNEALEIKVDERTSELEETVNRLLFTNSTLEQRELQLKEALSKEIELNELKSRFVSMASHEFRTPLSTILSSATLISKYIEAEQNEKRQKHIDRIKSSVNNLTGILNDFLSLSKIEEGKEQLKIEEIDINKLCIEIHDEIKGLLKKDQHLNHNQEADIIIYSDKRILKNILFNLISNAIKYSPENTKIDCVISSKDNLVHIQIKDYGIGIPLEDQKHIFSRFFRASNVVNIQGTGLGLNIVKRYVELLGGEISFKSSATDGTIFKIIIPIKNEKAVNN